MFTYGVISLAWRDCFVSVCSISWEWIDAFRIWSNRFFFFFFFFIYIHWYWQDVHSESYTLCDVSLQQSYGHCFGVKISFMLNTWLINGFRSNSKHRGNISVQFWPQQVCWGILQGTLLFQWVQKLISIRKLAYLAFIERHFMLIFSKHYSRRSPKTVI